MPCAISQNSLKNQKLKQRADLDDIREEQEHPVFLLDNTGEESDVDLLLDTKGSDQVVEKLDTEMMMVRLTLVEDANVNVKSNGPTHTLPLIMESNVYQVSTMY